MNIFQQLEDNEYYFKYLTQWKSSFSKINFDILLYLFIKLFLKNNRKQLIKI